MEITLYKTPVASKWEKIIILGRDATSEIWNFTF